MTKDLIGDLARLQNYSASLQKLLTAAQSAAPVRSEGKDRTGMVGVTLGADGLPRSFRVRPSWRRRIAPASLGQAVLEASHTAMGTRLAIWTTTLDRRGWRHEVDELRSSLAAQPVGPPVGQVPSAFWQPQQARTPRSIDAVAEDMIRSFDKVADIAASRPHAARGTGSDRSGKVSLTLAAASLDSCDIDTRWAATQTATRLTTALSTALAAARTDLAKRGRHLKSSSGLDDLCAEAFALLKDPHRVTQQS